MVALTVKAIALDIAQDCALWDAFVREQPQATVFHLSAWGRAIEKTFGHKAYYFAAVRGQDMLGILPLLHVKSRLFGNSLISNAFAVYGGPVAVSEDAHAVLDGAAWGLAQKLGIKVLEYRNQERLRPDWVSKSETYATFKRALTTSSDDNLKAIPRKQRAEVRKSLDKNLDVLVDRNADRHFAVYAESVRNLGTPVFPKSLFHNLLETYGNEANVLSVMHEGKPISSVLSLYFRNEVLPYYGGGVEQARDLRGNDHMYWMLIEHARARGCASFDFGRSKLGTGAFAFKKNWGFEPTPLHYEYKLAEGGNIPDINPLNPKYKAMVAVWQRLPLPLANIMGPFVSRALG
jgi:FemAB-related protein (PEP-CTERM system-associated)